MSDLQDGRERGASVRCLNQLYLSRGADARNGGLSRKLASSVTRFGFEVPIRDSRVLDSLARQPLVNEHINALKAFFGVGVWGVEGVRGKALHRVFLAVQ
jgi:hypothetical protein